MVRGSKPVTLSLTAPKQEPLQTLVRRRSTHLDMVIQPRRQDIFKMSRDPAFVDKVRDVVEL